MWNSICMTMQDLLLEFRLYEEFGVSARSIKAVQYLQASVISFFWIFYGM